MSGGTELFLLVIGVDLTIGPFITLIIFNNNKLSSELLRDVAIVIALQLGALGYGLYMVITSRPVVLALEEDRFRVVSAHDVYMQELPLANKELRSLSLTGPRLVRSRPVSKDPKSRSDDLKIALKGYDVGARPSLWSEWDETARKEALGHARPVSALSRHYPNYHLELDIAVAKTGRSAALLAYIPVITFRGDWVALLDSTNGNVVGFAPFDGFFLALPIGFRVTYISNKL